MVVKEKYYKFFPNIYEYMILVPSPPQNLRVVSETSDSIKIEWEAPAEPNGEIQKYVIKYSSNNISVDSLGKRDYCQNGIVFFLFIK